ncbi:MAG: helix-turn-helix transcriptional regulator [Bacteroidales bacterium]|nr:helix-turn-helix transcriptional regulator [Bacteroidales bacterium]
MLIICRDNLIIAGLISILKEYFAADNINVSDNLSNNENIIKADFIFINPVILSFYFDIISKFSEKIILISGEAPPASTALTSNSQFPIIYSSLPLSDIVEQLEKTFTSKSSKPKQNKQEELSKREIEVLQLVAKGSLNKQIADELNISLHTVISHRKNITRKLGIKTVSGLTVYAIINGLISADNID